MNSRTAAVVRITSYSSMRPSLSQCRMNPVIGLSLGRIVVGAVSLAKPGLAARMFRLDLEDNPQVPYLARLFGSREIALGRTLLARGTTRRDLVLAGIAVDAADAATGVLAMQDGSVPGGPAMLIVPAASAPCFRAGRAAPEALSAQPSRNTVSATTPTTTITAQHGPGSRRPTVGAELTADHRARRRSAPRSPSRRRRRR